MEEKYIEYFREKLTKLPELREYSTIVDNSGFEKWWNSILATCERMGEKYKRRADRIHFYPQVFVGAGDDSAYINERYQSGLNQAGASLETLIEELQTWGLDDGNNKSSSRAKPDPGFNLYLTVSQQQAQQIIQTINLDDYDNDTKEKVTELFAELNKKDKDKPKISNIIKWLADKGVDALIAVLLAKANLT